MSAADLILDFLSAAHRSLALFRAGYFKVERVWGRGLVAFQAPGDQGLRNGPLADGGEFSLHGFGCAFDLATGEFVDIDWNDQGDVTFNIYRLQDFAESVGRAGDWTDDELQAAADWLVSAGELTAAGGDWYAFTAATD